MSTRRQGGTRMTSLLNCIVQVILNDTRIMTGQLLAFDRHMNLVIADTQESRVTKAGAARQRAAAAKSAKAATSSAMDIVDDVGESSADSATGADSGEVKRTLGMIILRGEHIVSLTVISPPPADPAKQKTRLGQYKTSTAGAGTVRPLGRGLAQAQQPPQPPPGALSAPVRGVGGPAPGAMKPSPSPFQPHPAGPPMHSQPLTGMQPSSQQQQPPIVPFVPAAAAAAPPSATSMPTRPAPQGYTQTSSHHMPYQLPMMQQHPPGYPGMGGAPQPPIVPFSAPSSGYEQHSQHSEAAAGMRTTQQYYPPQGGRGRGGHRGGSRGRGRGRGGY